MEDNYFLLVVLLKPGPFLGTLSSHTYPVLLNSIVFLLASSRHQAARGITGTMDWTEEEEDALLAYLRDINNNESFWKRNTKREMPFRDCAIFLSRQFEQRRRFETEDVKAFCTYLVEERYRLDQSNLSHLFRIGLFKKKNGEPCDIFTRDECRKFTEEDKAREKGQPIPEEPEERTAPSLTVSESVTRRGARYKSTDWETDDGKNLSNTARKCRKSENSNPVAECDLL